MEILTCVWVWGPSARVFLAALPAKPDRGWFLKLVDVIGSLTSQNLISPSTTGDKNACSRQGWSAANLTTAVCADRHWNVRQASLAKISEVMKMGSISLLAKWLHWNWTGDMLKLKLTLEQDWSSKTYLRDENILEKSCWLDTTFQWYKYW